MDLWKDTPQQRKSPAAASLGPLAYTLVVDLGLMLLGWAIAGGGGRFQANPARTAVVILFVLAEIAAAVIRWRIAEPAEARPEAWYNDLYREDWRFLNQEMIFALAPFSDRGEIAVLPDNAWIRLAGVAMFAAGCVWMLWTLAARRRHLQKMPAGLRQPLLIESGPYRLVRLPVFTGIVLRGLGLSLAFRSLGGLFLLVLMMSTLIRRSNWVERDAAAAVPLQWSALVRRTKRVVPGIY